MKNSLIIFLILFVIAGRENIFATDSVEMENRTILRVCADPNNLPFSNDKQEGFENKIAELIGKELNIPIEYYWFPQGMGFVNKTLKERNCDLIAGISLTNELLQNSNPYYTSTYVMVFRKDAKIKPKSLNDPAIKNLRKGIVARTPPVTVLALTKNLKNFKSFPIMVDTRKFSPNKEMIDEVLAGTLDVVFMWGPLGGYYVNLHKDQLEYVQLNTNDYDVKMDFQITMGVRYGEKRWKQRINQILRGNKKAIDDILQSYGTPLLSN